MSSTPTPVPGPPAPSRCGWWLEPPFTAAWARRWFEECGAHPELELICAQGRERYAWLLAEVERLRRLLEDSSHA